MGRGRIILPAVDPNDIDIEDLKPGQVALFGDSTKNGNLTMKRKDGTTEDLAEKGQGDADLTEVLENTDVTKIDSFSEVVEYVNSSNEENFNTVYPKWVDYSVGGTSDVYTNTNGIDGRTYTIEFELNPQIRMGSEQVNFNRILHPSVYNVTESEINPGYIEKITVVGTLYDDPKAAGQSNFETQKGDFAAKLYDIYVSQGLTVMKNQYLNFYGVAGAIKVLNFINPDIEKDKITAELQAIIDACDPQLDALNTQINDLDSAEAQAVETYENLKKSLDAAGKAKEEEIANATDQAIIDALAAELNAIKIQAEQAATARATENNQYNTDREGLIKQSEILKKECAEAKKQLEALNEDLKSVSDTIRVKIDVNNRIILPRVEYLYLTDPNGNRIKKLVDQSIGGAAFAGYETVGFTDPNGSVWFPEPTDPTRTINDSSIYLVATGGTILTKTTFVSGIWYLSVGNTPSNDGSQKVTFTQKKILSFDTK